ncbi:MAG TPA: TetR family transcriptional regulator [Gemmatimonadaceae bacterium]|nr:TetR family transcriptional regulator [Gemmatimonadaceae bacterium]
MATGKATGAKRAGAPTLTAADWVEAALQMIAERGVAATTVDALAQRLGVTKGSFYWHFAGRAELLDAALGRWEQQATTDSIAGLSAVEDPRRRLELMIAASSQPPRARSLYAALAAAADEPSVGAVLARVAARRIAYLAACYRDAGLEAPLADAMATFAYAAYRGLLQLAREAPAALPREWSHYPTVTAGALVPAPAPPTRVGAARRRRRG